jgi:hypothetical protein
VISGMSTSAQITKLPSGSTYMVPSSDGRIPQSKMPPSIENVTEAVSDLSLKSLKGKLIKEPLKYGGSLDQFPHEDLTPSTGTEFTLATQLSQLLKAPNADELIRDLAVLGNIVGYHS